MGRQNNVMCFQAVVLIITGPCPNKPVTSPSIFTCVYQNLQKYALFESYTQEKVDEPVHSKQRFLKNGWLYSKKFKHIPGTLFLFGPLMQKVDSRICLVTWLSSAGGPALMAEWSKVLPLTARCLSPLRACPDGQVV